MACGRPTVATDADESFPVRLAGSGTITPLDSIAFAEAVLKLLDNRELAVDRNVDAECILRERLRLELHHRALY
jgi:glycosyltransferase involved in cell wall biosynthesis